MKAFHLKNKCYKHQGQHHRLYFYLGHKFMIFYLFLLNNGRDQIKAPNKSLAIRLNGLLPRNSSKLLPNLKSPNIHLKCLSNVHSIIKSAGIRTHHLRCLNISLLCISFIFEKTKNYVVQAFVVWHFASKGWLKDSALASFTWTDDDHH